MMSLKKDYFSSTSELPIWNWWEIVRTGDLVYLNKSCKGSINGLGKIWYNIHDEYLNKYGRTDDFKSVLRLRKRWIEKQCQYILNNDRFALMESELLEIDIADEIGSKKSMSNDAHNSQHIKD